MNKLTIRESKMDDLNNIMNLWNDGEVTKFVGFPNGIGVTIDKLEKWLIQVKKNPLSKHFSIYHEDLGYCGETFYSIDSVHNLGTLDIKLFPKARGKGIGRYALEFSISEVFKTERCTSVYVDPRKENQNAWALYKKIGFKSKDRPVFLEPDDVYLELSKDEFRQNSNYTNTEFSETASK